MTARRRPRALAPAKLAFAGLAIGFAVLTPSGLANAQPGVPPIDPGAPPPPGQPYVVTGDAAAPPAPPPGGAPPVPEIADPHYGSGKTSGPLGFIRDAWHQAQDPYGMINGEQGDAPVGPPPGAGPAPQLPAGYTSMTDPSSNGPALAPRDYSGGPALPPGYYPVSGPPPPGYFDAAPPGVATPPGAPIPAAGPLLPTP